MRTGLRRTQQPRKFNETGLQLLYHGHFFGSNCAKVSTVQCAPVAFMTWQHSLLLTFISALGIL